MIKFIHRSESARTEFPYNIFNLDFASNSSIQFFDTKNPNVVYIITDCKIRTVTNLGDCVEINPSPDISKIKKMIVSCPKYRGKSYKSNMLRLVWCILNEIENSKLFEDLFGGL